MHFPASQSFVSATCHFLDPNVPFWHLCMFSNGNWVVSKELGDFLDSFWFCLIVVGFISRNALSGSPASMSPTCHFLDPNVTFSDYVYVFQWKWSNFKRSGSFLTFRLTLFSLGFISPNWLSGIPAFVSPTCRFLDPNVPFQEFCICFPNGNRAISNRLGVPDLSVSPKICFVL